MTVLDPNAPPAAAAPAAEGAPAAGAAAPAAPAPAAAAPVDAKTYTQAQLDELLKDRARRAEGSVRGEYTKRWREMGFETEDAAIAALAEAKRLQDAQKTEAQRNAEAAARATKELEELRAQATAATEAARRLELFVDHDVATKERSLVGFLLDAARREAGAGFDETRFFTDLRAERPYLFRPASAGGAPAAAPAAPVAGSSGAGGALPPPAPRPGTNGLSVAQMSKDQLEAYAAQMGVDPRFIPRM